jgi:hypothetical protein
MKRFLLALSLVAGLASTAAAHGGVVRIRATPFRPRVGAVVVAPQYHAAFRQDLRFVAPYYSQSFRYGYSAPFFAQSFYAPQPIYVPAPQPIVIQQPAPVVYAEQPSLSYSQGYSYSGQTQAIRQETVYRLPDGRLVLPSGQVIDQ